MTVLAVQIQLVYSGSWSCHQLREVGVRDVSKPQATQHINI